MTMPCKLVNNHTAPVRLYDVGISAGFPSPAQDYEEPRLRLNDLLIKNPDATYLAKASGDSMIGAGINDGDMLVVDHGLTNYKDKVVIACVNGEFNVKRYMIERARPVLKPHNAKYSDIHFTEYDEICLGSCHQRDPSGIKTFYGFGGGCFYKSDAGAKQITL